MKIRRARKAKNTSCPSPVDFILKLAKMLSDHALEDIIAWTPDGSGVLIQNRKKAEAEALPKYFKRQLYESFLRHLNLYGFSRDPKKKNESHESIYRHPLFLRDSPELWHRICKGQKREINELKTENTAGDLVRKLCAVSNILSS